MEILVLGDGRFVFTVLNAVASVDAYKTLGAAGALIGLAIVLVKSIVSPQGPQLNLAPILVSIVFFWVMFVPRVDRVMVTEVLAPPGSKDPRTYVVDNVPLGLAGAGFLVSNIGVKISGLYDDVMSRADDDDRIMSGGGLGRNLMLLTMIREMVADPRFGQVDVGETNAFLDYRKDMAAYMENCVLPPVNTGYMPSNMVLSKPVREGVYDPAFALEKRFVYQRWAAAASGGSLNARDNVTCAEAQAHLISGLDNGALVDGFDEALRRSKAGADVSEIMAAYSNAAGADGMSMQEKIVGHLTSVMLREAQMRGAMTSSDRQAIAMLEEANLRRSTQWAAEENLFIRLLRPLVGFFEALFYALGPIMAFVMMLGPTGWGLLMKYLMLTVWVALWFPMLAITNLYSKIKMEDFFAKLGSDNLSPNDLDLIANEAMTTLGATSALVAATPALAMSLIYGGAVAMSHLAGRLQHSDVVDETKLAPQVSGVAPVQQTQSQATTNAGEGTTHVGREHIQVTGSDVAANITGSSRAEASEVAIRAAEAVHRANASGASIQTVATDGNSTSQAQRADAKLMAALKDSQGITSAEQDGINFLNKLSSEERAVAMQAFEKSGGVRGEFVAGLSSPVPGVNLGAKMTAFAGATWTGADQNSSTDAEGRELAATDALFKALQLAHTRDETLEASVAAATVAEANVSLSTSGATGLSTEDGTRLQHELSESQRITDTYTEADSYATQLQQTGSFNMSQLTANMWTNGGDGGGRDGRDLQEMVARAGGQAALEKERQLHRLNNSAFNGTAEQANVAASWLALNQRGDHIPADLRGEADALVGRVAATNSVVSGGSFGIDRQGAGTNAGVAPMASGGAGTLASTAGLPGASGAGVRGQAAAAQAAAGSAIQAAQADLTERTTGLPNSPDNLKFDPAGVEAAHQERMDGSVPGQLMTEARQQGVDNATAYADGMMQQNAIMFKHGAEDRIERIGNLTGAAQQLRSGGHVAEAERVEAYRDAQIPAMANLAYNTVDGYSHASGPREGVFTGGQYDQIAGARDVVMAAGGYERFPDQMVKLDGALPASMRSENMDAKERLRSTTGLRRTD